MAESDRVLWEEWGPEAFARAQGEGKLVFLDISATWCHWCHVLDGTSLSDPRVVRLLNESYVPVRVDTDRRPDINDRYNQGGWPTTAVLLHDGRLLTGATYLPPDALYELLVRCAEFYRRDRGTIEKSFGTDAAATVEEKGDEDSSRAGPGQGDLALLTHQVMACYDPVHPGFFREPKFPMTDALAFLRDSWIREGNREAGTTFLAILRTMGASGVFDFVEGGFFRYATKRDWSEPHYEKLLVDNAELLSLYASACEASEDPAFFRVGREILRFLFLRLHDDGTGAFFSSQDADEDYFRRDAQGRKGRPAPGVDKTVFSEYNGRAVSALAAAHRAFGKTPGASPPGGGTLLDRAERLGTYLHAKMWSPERGQIRFLEGKSRGSGLLADNVAAAEAHMDLWEAARKPEHLTRAGDVVDWTVRRLFQASSRGFIDRLPGEGDSGPLAVPMVPFAANARMAVVLLRYARATGRTDLSAAAELTLGGLSAGFDGRSAFAAPYGSALLLYRIGGGGNACRTGDEGCAAG
jgi:uncharacterized protein YyaL (SSP411 family)